MSSRLSPRRPGFTLLDMVMTVLILGIVAAIAVPRFASSMEQFEARAAAQLVAADLNHARSRAKLTGSNVEVQFDAAAPSYRMPTVPHLNRSGQTYAVDLREAGFDVTLAINFNGTTSLTYTPQGLAMAGAPLAAIGAPTIQVTSGQASAVVQISPQTGRASAP